jgi:TonB-dependent starch-binding outer membrane protein SusC
MKSMISLLTRFTKTIAIAKTVALLIFLTPIQINATNLNTDGLKLIPGGDDVSIVKVVTGKVTTDKGNPLPGVTIAVKGTSRGLITDAGGNYSIEVDPGETLIFSFIGFRPQEIVVGNQTQINISLVIDVIGLDEVVAIGYGYQKKSDLTGAVVSVSKEDLTMGGSITSAAQTLQGRVAGVVVSTNSKEPGGSMSVRIRGSNSISSSNEPLYVIDGFPASFVTGASLNPNDIESMQILKDASATAIYGARGANGVILITTKRGQNETSVTYDSYYGVQNLHNPFEMLNGKQYMNLANDLHKEFAGQENEEFAAYTQSQLQSDVDTDWIAETTRPGKIQNHFLQVNGGSDKTKVMASFGYYDHEGVLLNTDLSRFTGRVNIDQEINEYIKIGASVFAMHTDAQFKYYDGYGWLSNVIGPILNYSPVVPAYNADGTWGRPPGEKGDNPVANLLGRDNNLKDDKLNTNMYVQLKPLKSLTVMARGGYETNHHFHGRYLKRSTFLGGIDNGVAHFVDGSSSNQIFNTYVTYNNLSTETHKLSIMGGYSYEKFIYEERELHNKGYSTDLFSHNNPGAGATVTGVNGHKYENLLISLFGRANYSLNDKYLMTFTLRRDGSSRFGVDNQWGTFPSGAIAWRLIQEPFIQNLNVFSNLKLRAGYGKTGNDQIGNYASYALVRNSHYTFDGSTNVSGTELNSGSPENTALKWETTSQYNVGLDMGFFNGRLSLMVDAYSKTTDDLLVRVNLPSYSGFSSGQSNVGSMTNKGIEVDLTSMNFTGDFTWATNFMFSLNRNKVVKITDAGDDIYFSTGLGGRIGDFAVIREGESLGSLFGFIYDGVMQEGETYAPQPQSVPGDPKFRDISGPDGTPDGVIDALDRTIIGSAYPDYVFGLNNTMSYKNFDLSFFVTASVGNELMNVNRIFMERTRTTDALNRWTPENTDTDQPRNGFLDIPYGSYTNSHFVEDASYLRMKNLTLGYSFQTDWKFVESIRIYFSGEDLFTFTEYTGWNPEVSSRGYTGDATLRVAAGGGPQSGFNGGNSQNANGGAGLDWNSYPAMKTFTFGISVKF